MRRTGAGGVCGRCCCEAFAIDPVDEAGGAGEGGVTCTAGGACGGTAVTFGLAGGAAAAGTSGTVFSTAAGGAGGAGVGALNEGRGVITGLITRLAGASGAGGAAAIFSTGGGVATGVAGLATGAGGAATGAFAGGAAGASAFLRRRLATSPGLEIWERSIFVLIPDSPPRDAASRAAVAP